MLAHFFTQLPLLATTHCPAKSGLVMTHSEGKHNQFHVSKVVPLPQLPCWAVSTLLYGQTSLIQLSKVAVTSINLVGFSKYFNEINRYNYYVRSYHIEEVQCSFAQSLCVSNFVLVNSLCDIFGSSLDFYCF